MPDIFYEYKIPQEMIDAALQEQQERTEMKNVKPATITEIQTILSRAKEWKFYKENPWDLVACASILCGRTMEEIICEMEWERVSDTMIRVNNEIIPILIPYQDFDVLMKKIRETRLLSTNGLKPSMIRLFGKWYPHGHRYDIYCKAVDRLFPPT